MPYSGRRPPRRARTRLLITHCSATPPNLDIGAAEIDRWHRRRGWRGIGYHFVVRRNGLVEPGRPLDSVGAHARGANQDSVGLCLIGGVTQTRPLRPEANFTPAQLDALAELIADLKARYPLARILGHRDLPGVSKACPSFDVRAWLSGRLDSPAGVRLTFPPFEVQATEDQATEGQATWPPAFMRRRPDAPRRDGDGDGASKPGDDGN